MSRKGFLLKVELDVRKITCPGVWLCSNGKVSLQIHMLDSCIQTTSCKPVFPISCYEKFVFYKTFTNDRRLNELQRSLNNEWFYAELIQWQNCEEGCVLAIFQTTLDDLLYPNSARGAVAGMDIDLLMEPTKVFPGTISPKLEVTTKTTIQETLCDLKAENTSRVIINPKLLTSTISPPRKTQPRKVCHSIAFSRAQKRVPVKEKKHRPPFQYRKAQDDLLLRNNPNIVNNGNFRKNLNGRCGTIEPTCYCYCNLRSRSLESISSRSKFVCGTVPENSPRKAFATCHNEKTHEDCPICSKYDGLFACGCPKPKRTDTCRPLKLCSHCRRNQKCYLPSGNRSPCDSDGSERYGKKVCFCIPSEKSSLAQQLHEKLTKTLDSNSRFLRTCIDCNDMT